MWPSDDLGRRWLGVNVAATAVLLTWLSTQRGNAFVVEWTMAGALGLTWGAAQWLVLRRSALTASWLWLPANAAGWMLGTPLLLYATGGLSPSLAAIIDLPRTYDAMYGLPFPLGVGLFILLTLLAFFGIWAGVPLAGGQWLLLRLRPSTREVAQPWLGQSAWGWTIGLFMGGGLTSLLVIVVTAVPGVHTLPLWLVYGLTGAITGVIYSAFTIRMVTNTPEVSADPLRLGDLMPPSDAD